MLIQPRLSDGSGREFGDTRPARAGDHFDHLKAVFRRCAMEHVPVLPILRKGANRMPGVTSRWQPRNSTHAISDNVLYRAGSSGSIGRFRGFTHLHLRGTVGPKTIPTALQPGWEIPNE